MFVIEREIDRSRVIVSRDVGLTALPGKVKQNARNCVERALLKTISRMKTDGFNYMVQNWRNGNIDRRVGQKYKVAKEIQLYHITKNDVTFSLHWPNGSSRPVKCKPLRPEDESQIGRTDTSMDSHGGHRLIDVDPWLVHVKKRLYC